MRALVGYGFYFFGAMGVLNTLLNACAGGEQAGEGIVVSLIFAAIFLGIGHLIHPIIGTGNRGGVPLDPAEYARIQRDRALDAARQERAANFRDAQSQLDAMKREIIAKAEARNRELGGR